MAVTSRRDEQGNIINSTQYQPSQSVQDAQKQMQQYQSQQPAAYQPSQNVVNAQQALEQNMAQKPQGYNSKYGPALEGIMQQIQNPSKFKYEFNGDAMFKNYADIYAQNAKQASMNAMGQAAALTGGYGNTSAQAAANQAYNEEMRKLYDRGMELQEMAYQRHKDERADKYNQLGALQGMDEMEYGRHRDDVADWQVLQQYLADRLDTERGFDYNEYRDAVNDFMNNRDYYTNLYQNEANRDYSKYADQRDYDERVRQFEESLSWEKMSSDQKYAAEYAMTILANGQMPSEEMLQAAGLSPADAQKMMAQLQASGGGGGGKKSGNEHYYVDNANNVYYVDKNGLPVTVDPAKLPANTPIDDSRRSSSFADNGLNAKESSVTITNSSDNIDRTITNKKLLDDMKEKKHK